MAAHFSLSLSLFAQNNWQRSLLVQSVRVWFCLLFFSINSQDNQKSAQAPASSSDVLRRR
jgi:hypothetical protein